MAAPCSAGSAPACSTSAKSIDSSTSRPPERVAPLGRSAHLARAQTRNGARRRDGDRERRRRHRGCDYALVGEQGVLPEPRHLSRTGDRRASVVRTHRPTKSTRSRRIQFCRSTRSISSTRHASDAAAARWRCVSARYRSHQLLADGDMTAEFNDATPGIHRRADAIVGDGSAADVEGPTRIRRRSSSRDDRRQAGADAHPRSRARVSWRRPATTPVPRSRRSVPMGTAHFCSSGTWSLLGTGSQRPVITARARELNFTNEGGVCGTTLAQEHRRPLVVAGLPSEPGGAGPPFRLR